MASTIKLKNGSGAPLAGDLVQGEPALDLTNKRLYTEDSLGNVIEVGINPTSVTTGNITSSGTVSVDTIAEKTAANGVVVDGVTLKDGGITVTADVAFGDSDKAIFGAGSDLQIYHDGTHSYIKDAGTGNFIIEAADYTILRGTNSNLLFAAQSGQGITGYYNGSVKLATTSTGVDVTGTVTADGLTIDGSGTLQLNAASTTDFFTIAQGGTTAVLTADSPDGAGNMVFKTAAAGVDYSRMLIGSSGDISFYEDTGTTAKFFWDASTERLGLGTTSPAANLQVHATSAPRLWITSDGNNPSDAGALRFAEQQNGAAYFEFLHNGAENKLTLTSSNGDFVTFARDSLNVGIGTASPSVPLHVVNASPELRLQDSDDNGYLAFNHNGANSYVSTTQGGILFRTSGTTERARIDSSGNLLVGKTSTALNVAGVQARANGLFAATRDGGQHYFTRLTSDGSIVDFLKDSTTVGSIGAKDGDLFINTDNTGLRFVDAADSVRPVNSSGNSRDAAIDLGASTARFKDLYLSGGVYLGGTGAANLLDDYEEGTFTPVVEGTTTAGTGTYSYQFGYYTKIGREVKVYIRTAWTAHTGTGNMIISGLPFTSSAANGYTVSAGSINIAQVAFPASTTSVVPVIAPSSTQIQITSIKDNLSNVALQMDSSCPLLTITISYFV